MKYEERISQLSIELAESQSQTQKREKEKFQIKDKAIEFREKIKSKIQELRKKETEFINYVKQSQQNIEKFENSKDFHSTKTEIFKILSSFGQKFSDLTQNSSPQKIQMNANLVDAVWKLLQKFGSLMIARVSGDSSESKYDENLERLLDAENESKNLQQRLSDSLNRERLLTRQVNF